MTPGTRMSWATGEPVWSSPLDSFASRFGVTVEQARQAAAADSLRSLMPADAGEREFRERRVELARQVEARRLAEARAADCELCGARLPDGMDFGYCSCRLDGPGGSMLAGRRGPSAPRRLLTGAQASRLLAARAG